MNVKNRNVTFLALFKELITGAKGNVSPFHQISTSVYLRVTVDLMPMYTYMLCDGMHTLPVILPYDALCHVLSLFWNVRALQLSVVHFILIFLYISLPEFC